MSSATDRIKRELEELHALGTTIFVSELKEKRPSALKGLSMDGFKPVHVHGKYQQFYDRSLGLFRSLAPERYDEFKAQYEPDPKRKEISFVNYTIRDYLLGLRVTRFGEDVVDPVAAFSAKIQHQILMLESLKSTFESKIRDVREVMRSELFSGELDSSLDLLKKGHLRAAGAVAGVVLEHHLGTVCAARNISFRKKSPTIADYNDALKDQNIYDVPQWRFIQRLGDIRNLCVHQKERAPKKEEVEDLIAGVRKVIAEVS